MQNKMIKYQIKLFLLFIISFVPGIALAQIDSRIVQTRCDIDNYKEQLSDNLYLVAQNQVNQDCILKDVPNSKIYLATNDPKYSDQWYLNNTSQIVNKEQGIADIDIDFDLAYPKLNNVKQGNTKIAIIDTGVAPISELSGKILSGYNFINDSTNTVDDNGHGTFISSIIASKTDNFQGIAGINDKVSILPIKVLDSKGEGYLADLIKGIQYAIDQNATIINLSLASTQYDITLNPVIENAYQRGIVVVAAAGNGYSNISTPSVSPFNNDGNKNWVIGVSTVNSRGEIPDYANYGLGVDVFAPGDNIIGYGNNGSLEYRSGTSVSTAIVSGVISAWRDYYGYISTDDVHNLINSSSKSGRLISMNNAMIRRSYPNGALIRTSNSGVFVVKQGVKRPIIDPLVFLSYYYRWEDILIVPQSSFDSIPTGDALPLREGFLIADREKVYVIEQGMKRPISSPSVFLGLGYKWSNIYFPSQAVLNNHPTGAVLFDTNQPPNGSVVFSDGTGAYLIENGNKKPFSTPYTYLTRYGWNDLMFTRRDILDSMPTSTEVYPQEGSIIRDDQSVYWVENNTKRPFASPNAFLGLGLSWNRVIYPPSTVLNSLSRGDIIQ